ncbi:hypothetical protein Agabi119p4_7936 [Agaricus bisporus var. burnettii]|uniref:BTB domain-containing protein n=1 Tax=Agaricus bisporus var. burnettii TaxID=192524 RepID=A0A8H7EZD2_AGABI|nr:hypothetical protein Agabi119p4_7936 [Agaricus bisporus var. burnettii]
MPPKPQQDNTFGRSPSLSPSATYYLRGGDLFFLLGHVLYRVHSYFFLRESAFWKRELVGSSTAPDAPLLQGNDSTNAIILEEDPKDFDCFLWVFYNENLGDFSAKLQDWITIMRYATRWDFPRIKDLAIQHLEKHEMNPIDRIKLYQENKLPEKYLFPLYVGLASRQELLGIEESRTLGIETLVLIQQARERLRAPTSPMGNKFLSPIRTDLKPADVFDIVSATFNISFGELPADPKPDPKGGSGSGSAGAQTTGPTGSGPANPPKGPGAGGGGAGRGRGGR